MNKVLSWTNDQKERLRAMYLGGLHYSEIAIVLNKTQGSVQRKLTDLRRELKLGEKIFEDLAI
jgi:DNA-directed RNA polymerase specialized sigma24 family protein